MRLITRHVREDIMKKAMIALSAILVAAPVFAATTHATDDTVAAANANANTTNTIDASADFSNNLPFFGIPTPFPFATHFSVPEMKTAREPSIDITSERAHSVCRHLPQRHRPPSPAGARAGGIAGSTLQRAHTRQRPHHAPGA